MKIFLFAPLFLCMSVTVAEPAHRFGTDNCFTNEPTTHTYFDPPQWRAIFSWHYDHESESWAHYLTENPFAYCENSTCYYYFTESQRHTGVRGTALTSQPTLGDTVEAEVRTKWSVAGVHTTLIPGVGKIVQSTAEGNCNLHS